MFKFLLIAAFVAVCQATSITRQDSANRYFLYSRDNPRVPVEIFPTVASVVQNDNLYRTKTAIVVHGHQESGSDGLNPVVKDAFLSGEDVAVIVVDWSTLAAQSYSNAVVSVPVVGQSLAELINLLHIYNRLDLDRLHLVGFGLGAHVVGFTGRHLNGNVARITGLDPSGSRWGSNSQRLAASDAKYVEVVHTDGDGLTANGIGTPLGHVDFFPNGGSSQPGCLLHTCSHNRAWEYFAATLEHDHLIGNLCTTDLQLSLNRCRGYTLHMGNNELVKYGAGTFRVNTGRTYPY